MPSCLDSCPLCARLMQGLGGSCRSSANRDMRRHVLKGLHILIAISGFKLFECSFKGFVVIERILLDTNTSYHVDLSKA